ncbi:MAG: GYF domain-containing protein [Oscillospiraceae bacterium]|jgi:hypothetical protein|nr:GYF domain-containing protein [Oscillospiraceae bacterium]
MKWQYTKSGVPTEIDYPNLINGLRDGTISPRTLVWKQGMAEWMPASSIPEIAADMKPPPQTEAVVEQAAPRDPNAPPPVPRVTYKAMAILGQTKSFIMLRVLATVVTFLACLLVLGIFIGIVAIFPTVGGGLAFLIVFLIMIGIYFLVRRILLYTVKVGHVAAIVEIIKNGEAPQVDGVGGAFKFSKNVIKNNFGTTAAFFVFDSLISGAVRQIMKFLKGTLGFIGKLPVVGTVYNILVSMVGIMLSYIDEAVLAYIFYRQDGSSVARKGCDGLVLFFQGWKGMFKGAAKSAAMIYIVNIACFLIFGFAGSALFGLIGQGYSLFGFLLGFLIAYLVNSIFVHPYVTVMMIKSYFEAISDKEPKFDIIGRISKFSSKFRRLSEDAGNDYGQPSQQPQVQQPQVLAQPQQVQQQPNAPSAKPIFCGECGAQNSQGMRFCGDCGSSLIANE